MWVETCCHILYSSNSNTKYTKVDSSYILICIKVLNGELHEDYLKPPGTLRRVACQRYPTYQTNTCLIPQHLYFINSTVKPPNLAAHSIVFLSVFGSSYTQN
jgi:hypothetical protein